MWYCEKQNNFVILNMKNQNYLYICIEVSYLTVLPYIKKNLNLNTHTILQLCQ